MVKPRECPGCGFRTEAATNYCSSPCDRWATNACGSPFVTPLDKLLWLVRCRHASHFYFILEDTARKIWRQGNCRQGYRRCLEFSLLFLLCMRARKRMRKKKMMSPRRKTSTAWSRGRGPRQTNASRLQLCLCVIYIYIYIHEHIHTLGWLHLLGAGMLGCRCCHRM